MKIVLIVLVVITIILLLFILYYGGFTRILPQISVEGGEILVYEEIKGDYKQSGKVMDKIYYSLLEKDKIETFLGFGIYYDNPEKVETDSLRSEAGCILEEEDRDKIDKLKQSYNIKIFPEKKYITAEFPYRGKLSVIFSIFRVYPVLKKFSKEAGFVEDSPIMEVYDVPNGKIMYRKEIIKLK